MTTRIITICNQKGGIGKTTTAVELASVCARTGKQVLAVDADTQRSLTAWVDQVDEDSVAFDVATSTHPDEIRALPRFAEYDLIFIDTPGSRDNDALVTSFLDVSDFVLITSEIDGLSIVPADRYIDELVAPRGRPYSVLLTKANSRRAARIQEAREFFAEADKPVFNTIIRQYAAHADAFADGYFVTQSKPRTAEHANAAADYQHAAIELLGAIANL